MLSRGLFVWEFDRKPRWVSGQPERRDPWSKQGNVIYCGRKIKPDQHGLKPNRPAKQTKAREEHAMGEDEKHAEILQSHPMHCLPFLVLSTFQNNESRQKQYWSYKPNGQAFKCSFYIEKQSLKRVGHPKMYIPALFICLHVDLDPNAVFFFFVCFFQWKSRFIDANVSMLHYFLSNNQIINGIKDLKYVNIHYRSKVTK